MTSWPNIGKGLRRGMKTPARPSRGRIEWAKGRPGRGPYFMGTDRTRFEGQSLVKLSHPYRTITGRTVYAPRILKNDPTLRDLRRLAAVAS